MTSQEERAREALADAARASGQFCAIDMDNDQWNPWRIALAAMLALAAEVREDAAKAFEEAVEQGYDPPLHKVDQCEHGRFGWEDSIACYDQHLHARIAAIRAQGGGRG